MNVGTLVWMCTYVSIIYVCTHVRRDIICGYKPWLTNVEAPQYSTDVSQRMVPQSALELIRHGVTQNIFILWLCQNLCRVCMAETLLIPKFAG